MDSFGDFLQSAWRKIHSYAVPTRHNAYRPRLLHTSWLLFFLALILTAEGVLLTNVFAGQSARDFLAAVLPAEVVEITNLERGFNNVPTVQENSLLVQAAEAKARDMAEKSYFAHTGPDGKEPWAWMSEAGYQYSFAGENLAVRFNESSDVVEAWMASPGHRANIVKPAYTEIGVGVAQGMYKGAPATFVVQYFGTPASGAFGGAAVSSAVGEQGSEVLGATAAREAKEDIARAVASVGFTPTMQAFSILAAAAGVILVLVFLTFAVHIQVQPVDLLLGGGGVAAVAIALLVLNFSFVGPAVDTSQSASVITATGGGVLIGESPAFIEPAPIVPAGDSELAS